MSPRAQRSAGSRRGSSAATASDPRSTETTARSAPRSRALRAVDRAAAERRAAYEDEIRRLISAGFEVVRQSGSLEPRIADIVRNAGLSNQAFYKHFPSKEDLLLAMLEDGIGQLCSYVAHRMEKESAPVARLRAGLDAILDQALRPAAAAATRPFALSRSRLAERFPAEVAESEARLVALLEAPLLELSTERAQYSFDDAESAATASLLHDLAMGWVERRLGEARRPKRAEADRLLDFALRGVGVGPASTESTRTSEPSGAGKTASAGTTPTGESSDTGRPRRGA